MRGSDLPEIRRLALFRDMRQDSFDALMRASRAQIFPPQLDLIRQGDPADFLHVVIEGAVELYASWAGRETTMAVVRPVGTFILAAAIRDAKHLMSARTLERSRIILIPAQDLRTNFRGDPDFAMSVTLELAACYRSVVRHAKGLKLRTSRERVGSYILRQSHLAGDAPSFLLPVEKRLLASYLGMTPENLSRALKSLEEAGVKVDGQRIIITDRKALTALAQPDPLIDGPDPEGVDSGATLPGVSRAG